MPIPPAASYISGPLHQRSISTPPTLLYIERRGDTAAGLRAGRQGRGLLQADQADILSAVHSGEAAASIRHCRYKEELLLASLVLAGFILYQVLKEMGVLPVIGFYEGPLGV